MTVLNNSSLTDSEMRQCIRTVPRYLHRHLYWTNWVGLFCKKDTAKKGQSYSAFENYL